MSLGGFLPRIANSFAPLLEVCADMIVDQHKSKFESPIEEVFFASLVLGCRVSGIRYEVVSDPGARPLSENQRGITICPQAQIGPYRVDFLIRQSDLEQAIVVECDGHDFHERTKEQAMADRSRDRALQVEGYQVMRFTGAEIYRDPFDVTNEVMLAFVALMGRANG